MSLRDRREILGGLSLLILPRASIAAETRSSADDAALVETARAYLRSLSSAMGRFVQTDPRGAVSTGTFYLQRPGKARFEYDPPSPLVIASNGFRVAVVNRRLKTIQAYPLAATPLGLLLSREIRIDRGVAIGAVTRRRGGFSIVARDANHRHQGEITLDFTGPPPALAGWTIIDPQGAPTKVRLIDFAPSKHFPGALFELGDPEAPQPTTAPG